MEEITIRRFRSGDEFMAAEVVRAALRECNSRDYPPEFIEENVADHSPEVIAARAKEAHFYVACEGDAIIGCGGISGYWGSRTESYLLTIFVLPEKQGRGVGRRIVETLEADEVFRRAWRTEVGSSLTAVGFYRRMGYVFRNGVTDPDAFGTVRMEKRNPAWRPLSELSLEELWQLFPVSLVPHREEWAAWYREEAEKLRAALPQTCAYELQHIGSTAIPGIWAKNIVDILLIAEDLQTMKAAKDALLRSGWLCMKDEGRRISMNKGYTPAGFDDRVFHLHLRMPGDEDERLFRDWLLAHPATAAEYEALKLALWKRYEHDRDGYTDAKGDFVRSVVARAKAADAERKKTT